MDLLGFSEVRVVRDEQEPLLLYPLICILNSFTKMSVLLSQLTENVSHVRLIE